MALLSFATVTTFAVKTTFLLAFDRFEIFFGGEKSTPGPSTLFGRSEETLSRTRLVSTPPAGGETLLALGLSLPWDDGASSPRISFILAVVVVVLLCRSLLGNNEVRSLHSSP